MSERPPNRRAAFAQVPAGTLRALERALGPDVAPEHRDFAIGRLRELLANCGWETVELPAQRNAA